MNRTTRLLIPLALLFLTLASAIWLVRPTSAVDWQSKVDPSLLTMTRGVDSAEFLIILNDQADLSHIPDHWTKEQKGRAVYEALTAVADATQPQLLADLGVNAANAQRFWVTNMVLVEGDLALIERMARRADVVQIANNAPIAQPLPEPIETEERTPTDTAWGITKINAPAVWQSGYTGQGVVIAGQDTGYDWDHPALINQYRGWDGTSADHNYNWHDSIHSGTSDCGFDSPEPCDDHSHGTHTAGTMVGNDLAPTDANWPAGATNVVGVAPGAKWIGCRNMREGWGTPTTYSECYQWFIAPTDLDGNNADPSKAPHVINNSWGCPAIEGCTTPDVLLSVVQSVRTAGIVNISSAGNYGSGCSTVRDPASIYDEVFSVASTTDTDGISSFSSRGPVTADGSNRLKPDIAAPGQGVRSATFGGGYHFSNGTSMAAPHVAGLVALMISAEPRLAGRVDLIEQLIRESADPFFSAQTCGSYSGLQIPNAVFGYGRINAQKAVNAALTVFKLGVTTSAGHGDCTGVNVLTLDKTPQTIRLCTTIQNSAYMTLTSQTITDSLGNVHTMSQTIPPNGSYTFSTTVTVTPTVIITAHVSAETHPFGISVSQVSNFVSVTNEPVWLPWISTSAVDVPTSFFGSDEK